jgi:hypothetical protein
MNGSTLDTTIRHDVVSVSRRGSLCLWGGAGLSGIFAAAAAADARKSGKKGKDRCRQLGEQCRRGVAEICGDDLDPQPCLKAHVPCCEHFARCRVSAGVECVIFND